MKDYIFRYISFAQFVDLVQTKTLCFVNPAIWDDKYEMHFLHEWLSKLNPNDSFWGRFYELLIYAQCWSMQHDSDAMWRIYGYNNQSLRITITETDAEKLENVKLIHVKYNNSINEFEENDKFVEIMLKLASQKRDAFMHEQEVRLIYLPQQPPKQKTPNFKIESFISKFSNYTYNDIKQKYSVDKLTQDIRELTVNRKEQTKRINYEYIPNFIKGVMVHPMASEWYVETVSEYCKINGIPFEGQSDLYKVKSK